MSEDMVAINRDELRSILVELRELQKIMSEERKLVVDRLHELEKTCHDLQVRVTMIEEKLDPTPFRVQ